MNLSILSTKMMMTFLASYFMFIWISVAMKFDGKDIPTCGSFRRPCKHLGYTIEEIIGDQDIIQIDGGITEPLLYEFEHSVNITRNIDVQKWNNSQFCPTISSKRLKISSFRFIVTGSIHFMRFTHVCFHKVSILDFFTRGSVHFQNCTANHVTFINRILPLVKVQVNISDSRIQDAFFEQRSTKYQKWINLRIINSSISASKVRLLGVCGTFSLERCLIHSSIVTMTISKLGCNGLNTLLVHDTRFFGKDKHSLVSSGNVSVHIYHSTFYKFILGGTHAPKIFIRNTTFSGSSITSIVLSKVDTLVFQGCIFANNRNEKVGTLRLLENKNVTFNACSFKNNSAYVGGALYVSKSVILVRNSNFHDNNALVSGGTIYSSDSEIYLRNVLIDCAGNNLTINGRQLYAERSVSDLRNVSMVVYNNTNASPIFAHSDSGSGRRKKLEFSEVLIRCPVGHFAEHTSTTKERLIGMKYFAISCNACSIGKYNLTSGYVRFKDTTAKPLTKDISCSTCEQGGVCDSKIKSAGNYWGFVNKKKHVVFTPCPVNYCCSSMKHSCSSYNTCAEHRTGKLCGLCENGFSLNLLSTSCVSNSKTTTLSRILFFVSFLMLSTLYAFFLMYLKDITQFCKRYFSSKESKFTPLMQSPDETSPSTSHNELDVTVRDDDITGDNGIEIQEVSPNEVATSNDSLVSGLIKIAFFFYQVEPLLRVHTPMKGRYNFNSWIIQGLLSSIFNIKVSGNSNSIIFAPFRNLDAIGKNIINVSFIVFIFLVLFSFYWISFAIVSLKQMILRMRREQSENRNDYHLYEDPSSHPAVPFPLRIKRSVLKLSLLGYITISPFAFRCVNCVPIENSLHLYIQGEVECYNTWQWFTIAFIVIYVVPYSGKLYFATSLLTSSNVTPNEFLFALLCPPVLLYYYIRSCIPQPQTMADEMVTEIYLKDLYEPFRTTETTGAPIRWECMLILRRLALVCASTFIIHPVGKLYAMLALLMAFLFNHSRVQPYSNGKLNMIDNFSMAMLCMLCSLNLFWAHTYMTNELNLPQFELIGEVFLFFELVVLVLPIIILVLLLVLKISKKFINFYKTCIYKQD